MLLRVWEACAVVDPEGIRHVGGSLQNIRLERGEFLENVNLALLLTATLV